MVKWAVLCFMVAVCLQLLTPVNATCCYAHKIILRKSKVCNDCTLGTPYCSQTGSCNIVGCNCDGGCRVSRPDSDCEGMFTYQGIGKRAVSTRIEDAHDVIRTADVDGDGKMSLEEARLHLGLSADRVRKSLMELDTDSDDFLSAHEIDNE